jgi:hypothetical protein
MSESVPPPPPYEEVKKPSLNQNSNPNWLVWTSQKERKLYFVFIFKNRQAWYRKFIELKFNQDEAVEYAKLFVNNDVEISMIPELSDDILKGVGIEKAGQ